jgi:uncharacterized protein
VKISGTASLSAGPQQVWDAFHDPAVLARCLPGCERLTELGPDRYAMTVTAGVAAVKGTYDGTVALVDPQPWSQFTLKATGAGGPGTVDAEVLVRLAPSDAGGTELSYDADAAVGGVIGGVGQRMLTGVSRRMADQFFQAVEADLAGVRAEDRRPKPKPPVEELPAGARPIEAVGTAVAAMRRRDFRSGVMAGAAAALAGVIVGWAIGGR